MLTYPPLAHISSSFSWHGDDSAFASSQASNPPLALAVGSEQDWRVEGACETCGTVTSFRGPGRGPNAGSTPGSLSYQTLRSSLWLFSDLWKDASAVCVHKKHELNKPHPNEGGKLFLIPRSWGSNTNFPKIITPGESISLHLLEKKKHKSKKKKASYQFCFLYRPAINQPLSC